MKKRKFRTMYDEGEGPYRKRGRNGSIITIHRKFLFESTRKETLLQREVEIYRSECTR